MYIYSITYGDLLNYPNHMATVIAFQGCDQSCEYCHNPHLITQEGGTYYKEIPYTQLTNRQLTSKYLVFTGGEPTIQPYLLTSMKNLKKEGYYIKLDTNSCFKPVSTYIKHLDYVALDVKHYHQDYLRVNVATCTLYKVPFELRFTTFGSYSYALDKIKTLIQDARLVGRARRERWETPLPIYIQKCNHPKGWSEEQRTKLFNELYDYVQKYKYKVRVRTR